MMSYIGISIFCMAVSYGYYEFVLHKRSDVKKARIFLLIAAASGLILPLISLPSSGIVQDSFVLDTVYAGFGSFDQKLLTPVRGSEIGFGILTLYIIVSAGMLVRLISSCLRIRAFVRGGRWTSHRGIRYYETEALHSPFSFFNTIYFSGQCSVSKETLYHVLLHEQVHCRNRHSLDRLFIEICLVFFWMNPFLYLIRKRLMENHEFAADHGVVSEIPKANYLKTLLGHVPAPMVQAPVHAFFQPKLNNRMKYLDQTLKKRGQWRFILFLPVLAALTIVVACREESGIGGKDLDNAQKAAALTDKGTEKDDVLKVAEVMPGFPGCDDTVDETAKMRCTSQQLVTFIGEHLKYPKKAEIEGIEGKVVLSFVIDKDGYLTDIEIVKDIGFGCGEEAVRVLGLMNTEVGKWSRGMQNGKVVSIQYTLPIRFELPQEKEGIGQ